MIFTKKQIKEFLGGLMSLNCTIGVCILYILFLWTCIFQDFYRILQVLRRLFGLFSANLRRITTEKMKKRHIAGVKLFQEATLGYTS